MADHNNLNETLLQGPSNPSHEPYQKAFSKRKRFRRSKSTPLIEYTHAEPNGESSIPSSLPFFGNFRPSFRKVFAYLFIYLSVGAICFYIFSHHLSGKRTNAIVDALYFSIVTMTTVGYGDLVPQTTLAKLFACAFVFSGMALIGLILSSAADYLVEKQEILLIKALHMRKRLGPSDIMREIETKKVRYKCLVAFLVVIILIIIGTMFLTLVEKLDIIDAFYCICVTITSLGYGDYSFATEGGRIFAVLWILTSTICLAQFFFYVAELNTERRQNELVKWVLTRRVTYLDLEAADIDNDRVVEAAEFILYKLKEMGKVSQEDISVVMKEFEELDVDQSGTLSMSDIIQAQSSSPE